MAGALQLPGIDQGLPGTLSGSAWGDILEGQDASSEGLAAQLRGWLDELDQSPDQLPPELQALLAQLLDGGGQLPPQASPDAPPGKTLPPFMLLAQAIARAVGGGESESEGGPSLPTDGMSPSKGSASLAGEQPAIGELIAGFREGLSGATGLRPGQPLEGLVAQAPGRPLPDGAVMAALLPTGSPQGSSGMAIPSQNLLSMPVPQPVGDPAWGSAIGERLVWMVKGDHQVAELKITPPNLGPMEIKLTINHDQASVNFVSHHALVRDALEAAIPRLREMLAEQSINLVQADVGSGMQQDPGQAAANAHSGAGHGGRAAGHAVEADGTAAGGGGEGAIAGRRGLGLLDLFV